MKPKPESCADCGLPLPWTKEQAEKLKAQKGQEYLLCASCEDEREHKRTE